MERTQRELPSISSDPMHSEDGGQPNESVPGFSVIVWDHQRSRLRLITHLISECGARPQWVEGFSAIQEVQSSFRCCIALVALGGCPSPGDLGLSVIGTLKEKGFKVISYEEGASFWPLGIQCQPLLTGALRLLDSTKTEFTQELRCLLTQLLRVDAAREEEEERIRGAMKDLRIVGESQVIISLFKWILRVSKLSDLPILITGETGTGKELIANAVHHLDPKRRNGPFIPVNCAAISPGLAESELFGHRRGAFTGADRDRKGLIRSAEGGILFLDEIGELDEAMETKLLRALQENRVLGIGEDQEVSVNVRVIAASNRDLEQMVQERKFRADLFHRLNVLSIHIPPLRERPEDIKPLIEHFLKQYSHLNPAVSVGPHFVEALMKVELPGNARQVENLVRQALVNKDDETPLNLGDLPAEVLLELSKQGPQGPVGTRARIEADTQAIAEQRGHDATPYLVNLLKSNGWNLSQSLKYCERLFLEAALHTAQGNQSQTARLLGITPRSVYNKLHKHHLGRSLQKTLSGKLGRLSGNFFPLMLGDFLALFT